MLLNTLKPEENKNALLPKSVEEAHARIERYIHRTPLLQSSHLNEFLGHEIIFKAECFQKIGAFKARGALNALLALEEEGNKPEKVVSYSSGNHAQAVAWAGNMRGVPTTVYLPEFVSSVKKQATRSYGAEVVETKTRQEAEDKVNEAGKKGAAIIPPFNNDQVIAGQGTACYEALKDGVQPDAIFTPVGGGGLFSGTYLAKELLQPKAKIFAVEPAAANDAARSLREGKIFRFKDSPETIADGARTLSVSERTFNFLKKADGIFEVQEEDIIYWTQWLIHLLKCSVEPTSALGMAAAFEWLKNKNTKQQVLIILSGGNISPAAQKRIWEKDYLIQVPCMSNCRI